MIHVAEVHLSDEMKICKQQWFYISGQMCKQFWSHIRLFLINNLWVKNPVIRIS